MIPAQELRIGNYIFIKWSKEYRKIDCLDIRDLAENRDCIQEQAEPILLTPSILEKCGFKTRGEGYNVQILEIAYQDSNYPCSLQVSGDGICVARSGIGAITSHINYLHQLQNLYFALTQIELNINL